MWHKIIYIVFIINILTSVSDGIHVSEFNDTKMFHSMNSQISELRAEQKHHDKLIEGIFKALDLQILKAEQERQGNLIDELKAEFKQQMQNTLDKESSIQLLKTELKELKTDKESRINFLTAELERQGKIIGNLNMQLNNQTFRAEQERQGKLIKELVQELENHNSPSCREVKLSGIYEMLLIKFSSQPFKVACDAYTQGGGWTIILKRIDGSVNFYRNWAAYKEGFGDLNGEFFLGLDRIHALTTDGNHELLVVLEDFEGNEAYELYDSFAIGEENQQYVLHTLGKASGTAGDALDYHRDRKFTTFDQNNDEIDNAHCVNRTGAWWYGDCNDSNLAGKYNETNWGEGVIWEPFKGYVYSLKKAVMMIRPKK